MLGDARGFRVCDVVSAAPPPPLFKRLATLRQQLHISAATAKTHVSRLLMKLGARDRAQLVMIAYESGLVVPGGV